MDEQKGLIKKSIKLSDRSFIDYWKILTKIIFVFIIVNSQLPNSLFAENELLIKVRKDLMNSAPFYLNFKQQVYDESDMITEESGNILFVTSSKVKWVYNDPEFKVFLIDKNKYQFYDKESNQLTKGTIKENRQKWIWQILFADTITDEIICDKKNKLIIIKNKEDDIDLKVYLGSNGLPDKVIQKQGAGVKYIYYFTNYLIKYKYTENIFNINLPDDVDIVEMN